jgi:uncharacterized peroxidase-related enzyme
MSFIPRIPEEEGSVSAILTPYPEIATPISMMTEYVMRSEDVQFTTAERELIATFVSDMNACTYCARTHQATAGALGVHEALFDALVDDIDTAPVDDKLKPVLKYVKKLTLTPTRMTQADADSIFDAGWDEKSFHFAIMICGMFNLYNRLLEGYGIKNTGEFREKAGRELAESGYAHVAERAGESN